MGQFKFGKSSLSKLRTCHEDLQKIMHLAISRSDVDFGISEGFRTLERQKELFDLGRSKLDGINKLSKHNHVPSFAVDIFTYHSDLETRRKLAYDKTHLAYLGGIITSCAKELFEKGEISHITRWGANWDVDGIIDYDQDFDDFPHIELV